MYTLIFVLCLYLNFTPTENKILTEESFSYQHCYLSEIEFLNPRNCVGIQDGGVTVSHMGHCHVDDLSDQHTDNEGTGTLKCNQGHWEGSGTIAETGYHRQKRFWEYLIGAAAIGCLLFCDLGDGGSGGQTIVKYPPSFADPCRPADLSENYYVLAGEHSAVVTWQPPIANDSDGAAPRVDQIVGGVNGGRFEGTTYGRVHYITYSATDDDGLTAHCHFNFTVTLQICDELPWPVNGGFKCDNNNILGSSCLFSCDTGFQLTGHATVTCQNDQTPAWTHVPSCTKITCNVPTPPVNGSLQCTDQNYFYQSTCILQCDLGWSLDGPTYIQCQADGTWSNEGLSMCKDAKPPTINCITPQKFYADRNRNTTAVTWIEPTAKDNSDPKPEAIKTSGPDMGDVLEVGSTIVTYKGRDYTGNESPECNIELRVEEIKCSHPLDNFDDDYLTFTCSQSRYTYGVTCSLSCLNRLPLNGTNTITCESTGMWQLGKGGKPYCREIACPELDPPINGALVYDSILTRPVYTQLCNSDYDIPNMGSNFNGMFFCTDSGTWTPYTVPDCIKIRNPRFLNLPAEIFYYNGDCGTNETMAQIEERFQQILETHLRHYIDSICPADETCTAENIVIKCGPISGRKKRDLYDYDLRTSFGTRHEHNILKRQDDIPALTVGFDIVVVLKLENTTLSQAITKYDEIQLDLIKPAIEEMVKNGTFDIEGFVLRNDSYQTSSYGDIKCDEGYETDGVTCKPCPLGYAFNDTLCEECPMGQYKNNESTVSCTQCPEGYSTRKRGSKSSDDCIKLCSPGSYSPDRMESCSPCLHGYYQDEYGQTSCKQCPSSTRSEFTNSKSLSDCKIYDVFIEKTNGEVIFSTIEKTLNSITVMFWVKFIDYETADVTMKLANGSADFIEVHLTRMENGTIFIYVNGKHTVAINSRKSWNHIAFVTDIVNNQLVIYTNGKIADKEALTTSSLQNGTFSVVSYGRTGIYLTGLHLVQRAMSTEEISNYSASCNEEVDIDAIMTTDAFLENEWQGVSILTSSTCNDADFCSSSPCNGHVCTNGAEHFTCTCLSGWTGTLCTVPPDHCINNTCENAATCQNTETSYTCKCVPGYTGPFCEVPPVDGGWSEWNVWGECSKTCGTGTKSRSRYCNSPKPGFYGKNCTGKSREDIMCNTETCPVCDTLERKSGTLLNCTTNQHTGTINCILYCEEDKFLPPVARELQNFSCGPETNYEWDSSENLPSCVVPSRPHNVTISTLLNYTSTIPNASRQPVIDKIHEKLELTPCNNSPHCEIGINLSDAEYGIGTTVHTEFRIPLHEDPDLQYEAFVSHGTVSAAILELSDAIQRLEATAQYVQNYSSDIYDIQTTDINLSSDPESLVITTDIICDIGYSAVEGICIKCPAGTFSEDGTCKFCNKGTYQQDSGQIRCINCPAGLTTAVIGSTGMSSCNVVKVDMTSTTFTSIESTKTTAEAEEDEEDGEGGVKTTTTSAPLQNDDVNLALVIGICVAVITVIVIISIIIVILVRRKPQKTISTEKPTAYDENIMISAGYVSGRIKQGEC